MYFSLILHEAFLTILQACTMREDRARAISEMNDSVNPLESFERPKAVA